MSQQSESSFAQSLSQSQYNSNGVESNSNGNKELLQSNTVKIEDKQQQLRQMEGVTIFDPKVLQTQFQSALPQLIQRPLNRKKLKGTNIPKFLLKIFFNNIPKFSDPKHVKRLHDFARRPQRSKTRLHLVELFGTIVSDEKTENQNQLNRKVLKRLLNRNYDNVLANRRIMNKRLYLMFCKKMMLRLNKPQLIDRLQI